jgi:periplasmic protein TonB
MSALTFTSIPATPRRKPRPIVRAPVVDAASAEITTYAPKTEKRTLILVAGIAALHVAGIIALSNSKLPVTAAPAAVPITIVMTPPKVTPPPKPEPAAPKPKTVAPVKTIAPPPPRIQVAATPVAESPLASVSNTPPEPVKAPLVAAAEPAPPPPPAEEPVTEPKGYAGYLHNPAPEYPVAAQKRGLEGRVVLKVHVLASGQPDSVTVAKSSGHQILDEAALKAVTQWAFAPARRGQTAIDGWVQVPLSFRI